MMGRKIDSRYRRAAAARSSAETIPPVPGARRIPRNIVSSGSSSAHEWIFRHPSRKPRRRRRFLSGYLPARWRPPIAGPRRSIDPLATQPYPKRCQCLNVAPLRIVLYRSRAFDRLRFEAWLDDVKSAATVNKYRMMNEPTAATTGSLAFGDCFLRTSKLLRSYASR